MEELFQTEIFLINNMKISRFILVVVLLTFSCAARHVDHKDVREKSLNLTITSHETWKFVSIRTKEPIEIDHIPIKFGMWFTPEPDFALKPHIVFQDAQGETFRFVYQMGFRNVPELGGYLEETLSKPEQIGDKNLPGGNGRIDAPVKFVGLDIPNRYPVYQKKVFMDNFTIDGKLIEDF